MNRKLEAALDWVSPGRVKRPSIPPLEGALRPNERLDKARVLASVDPFELDDVVHHAGRIVATRRRELVTIGSSGRLEILATLPGTCGPVVSRADHLVVAVDGHGLFAVDGSGVAHQMSSTAVVRGGVTDLCVEPGGTILATIASSVWARNQWSDALLDEDHTGAVVRIRDDHAETLVEQLAWPAGIAPGAEGGFVVTESLAARIGLVNESGQRRDLLTNLPAYPGRVRASASGWWVVAPYPRNRLTELVLSEPGLIAEMREEVEPDLWLVPRLGSRQVLREPLQHGQRRVLGQIRPWAPAWSYGLAFHVDHRGLVTESLHSRTDGACHGITGVACPDGTKLVLVAAGSGKVLEVEVGHV